MATRLGLLLAALLSTLGCGEGAPQLAPSAYSEQAARNVPDFGNTKISPKALALYMVPDVETPYVRRGDTGTACPFPGMLTSLKRMRALMPHLWVRWDNETGHNTNTQKFVEEVITCFQAADVPLIITGSAVDGYGNWWALGGRTPPWTLLQFANSPHLAHTAAMSRKYPIVKLVETPNEPDGPWFNSDGDNVKNFRVYMNKLRAVMGDKEEKILGPSAVWTTSNIFKEYMRYDDLDKISYHTYKGYKGLKTFPGKEIHVTEYGGMDMHPVGLLEDWIEATLSGKLRGGVSKIYYVQLFDNGSNRGALTTKFSEHGSYAFRDYMRTLIAIQALGSISDQAYVHPTLHDYIATDKGDGSFGMLLWRDTGSPTQARVVPNTSVRPGKNFWVMKISEGDVDTATCRPADDQNWVDISVVGREVRVKFDELKVGEAALIRTRGCEALVK